MLASQHTQEHTHGRPRHGARTPHTLAGFAVDISARAIAQGTIALFRPLNVTYIDRKRVSLPGPEPYDFCFIDGDHGYAGVRRDYVAFSS